MKDKYTFRGKNKAVHQTLHTVIAIGVRVQSWMGVEKGCILFSNLKYNEDWMKIKKGKKKTEYKNHICLWNALRQDVYEG